MRKRPRPSSTSKKKLATVHRDFTVFRDQFKSSFFLLKVVVVCVDQSQKKKKFSSSQGLKLKLMKERHFLDSCGLCLDLPESPCLDQVQTCFRPGSLLVQTLILILVQIWFCSGCVLVSSQFRPGFDENSCLRFFFSPTLAITKTF